MRRLAVLVALILFAGLPAAGDDDPADEGSSSRRTDNWVPAFALTAAFHGQAQKSSLTSQCDSGGGQAEDGLLARCSQADPLMDANPNFAARTEDPTLSGPSALRDAARGSELAVWPSAGIDFHLMTPRLIELPLDLGPRLFVNAELAFAFPPKRSTANEGDLTSLRLPEVHFSPSGGPTAYGTIGVAGAGSELVSRPKPVSYGVQLGLAFPVEVLNRRIMIKPSAAWIQYRIGLSGRVLAALKDDINGYAAYLDPDNATGVGLYGSMRREIDLSANKTQTINGIGPGVEVELDSGRFGQFSAAVFASAHAYKVLGKRKFRLTKAQTFAADPYVDDVGLNGSPGSDGRRDSGLLQDTYRATWNHEIDPWMYRLKLGIRFHYLGK